VSASLSPTKNGPVIIPASVLTCRAIISSRGGKNARVSSSCRILILLAFSFKVKSGHHRGYVVYTAAYGKRCYWASICARVQSPIDERYGFEVEDEFRSGIKSSCCGNDISMELSSVCRPLS